jgi:hypothetical protein
MTQGLHPADSQATHDRDFLAHLREVEQRVLWLSTAIVDHANRVRPNPAGMKVGGHQASSASIVSIMTALWFGQLRADDRVSVKPHASPVLHAIEYLLGQLDVSYLPRLREFGGLQSYPSRVKDPVPADYSTGSVASARPRRSGVPLLAATSTPDSATGDRPAVLPGRGRRAGRGRSLGGRTGPHGRRARRSREDRGLEPTVARETTRGRRRRRGSCYPRPRRTRWRPGPGVHVGRQPGEQGPERRLLVHRQAPRRCCPARAKRSSWSARTVRWCSVRSA